MSTGRLVLVIFSWACLVVAGFWFFEYRHWRAFAVDDLPREAHLFSGQVLQQWYAGLPATERSAGQIQIMHFYSADDCPCESYRTAHLADIQMKLAGIAQRDIRAADALAAGLNIPAVPAVAVWDEKGQLAYFGPYSAGVVCGQGDDFVGRVLNLLARGQNPGWVNTTGVGCFCPWRQQKQ